MHSAAKIALLAAKSADLRQRMAHAKLPLVNTANCRCQPAWACVLLRDEDDSDDSNDAPWPLPEEADQCHNCLTPTPDTSQLLLHLPCGVYDDKLHDVALYVCAPCADRLRQCTLAAPPPFTPVTAFERFCVVRQPDARCSPPVDAKRCATPGCRASEQRRLPRFTHYCCRATWYCCQACQRVDWHTHRKTCARAVDSK
jgi:hypothetical protein